MRYWALLAILVVYAAPAPAATRIWQGGFGTAMSDSRNWVGGVAPGPGDRISIPPIVCTMPLPPAPPCVPNNSLTADASGLSFEAIEATGPGVTISIGGHPIQLTGSVPISVNGVNLYMTADVVLTAANAAIATGTNGLLALNNVSVAGGTFSVNGGGYGISINGAITEMASTSLAVSGASVGINSLGISGSVQSTGGLMLKPDGMGTGTSPVAIRGAGGLQIHGSWDTYPGNVVSRAIDLGGSAAESLYLLHVRRMTAPLIVTGTQVVNPYSNDFAFDGPISGSGRLVVTRDVGATAEITSTANTFTGGLEIRHGAVRIYPGTIPDASEVTVSDWGKLVVGDSVETIRTFDCQKGYLKITAGAGELRINQRGTMSECRLELDIPPGLTNAADIMLIRNASGQPFAFPNNYPGFFQDLQEGAAVLVNGSTMYFTYRGGGGGDVMLLKTPSPVVPTTIHHLGTAFALRGGAPDKPLAVLMYDNLSRPGNGVRVNFTVMTPGCGSFSGASFAEVTGDAGGMATAPAFTAGNTTAVCTIRARTLTFPQVETDLTVIVFARSELTITPTPTPMYVPVNAGDYYSPDLNARFFIAPLNRGIADAAVTYVAPGGCGTFGSSATIEHIHTDSMGNASIWYWAGPATLTNCHLEASLDALDDARAVFEVNTYEPAGATLATIPAVVTAQTGATFSLTVELRTADGRLLRNVPVGWSVTPGASGASATITNSYATMGAGGSVGLTLRGNMVAGTFQVTVDFHGQQRSFTVTLTGTAPPPPPPPPPETTRGSYQDMWWSGMAENGWGMSIVQHADTLFSVIYAYDAQGQPAWFVMPGGTWTAATTYSGPVYVPQGSPYFAYDTARFVPGAAVGTVTLSFAGENAATLDYSINGISGRKDLMRQSFGPQALPPITGRGDMWWGGFSQNGWGIAVLQQHASLFSVWFTYDAAGVPTWFVMPAGTWTDASTYEGRIYRTTGSPWLGRSYDAAQMRAFDVGSFRLRFVGDNAFLDYTIDGRSGTVALSRQPF